MATNECPSPEKEAAKAFLSHRTKQGKIMFDWMQDHFPTGIDKLVSQLDFILEEKIGQFLELKPEARAGYEAINADDREARLQYLWQLKAKDKDIHLIDIEALADFIADCKKAKRNASDVVMPSMTALSAGRPLDDNGWRDFKIGLNTLGVMSIINPFFNAEYEAGTEMRSNDIMDMIPEPSRMVDPVDQLTNADIKALCDLQTQMNKVNHCWAYHTAVQKTGAVPRK